KDGEPCWLYFDLEYSRILNMGNPLDEMSDLRRIRSFLRVLHYFAETFCGIEFSPHDVALLQSSSPEKFSYHVIIKNEHTLAKLKNDNVAKINSSLFPNNLMMGQFVCRFLEWINNPGPE